MKTTPYLNYDGNTEEALTFYAKAIGAEPPALMRFGDTPAAEHVPAAAKDQVMHGCLQIGDEVLLMASDTGCIPDQGFRGHDGFSIALAPRTVAEAKRVFDALAEGGKVTMPLEKTFWAEAFGSLVDRFGVSWLINCEKDGG